MKRAWVSPRSILVGMILFSLLIPAPAMITPASGAEPVSTDVSITPENPPEGAQISQQIDLQSDSQSGEWVLSFPDSYANQFSGMQVTAADRSEYNNLETAIVDGPDADGINESIRVDYQNSGNSAGSALSLQVTLAHPSVTTNTSFEVRTYHNGTQATTETITVRDVENSRTGLTGTFDTTAGTGFVYPGATVYQGEQDITFAGDLTSQLLPINESSAPLEPPIPEDITETRYTTDGTRSSPGVRVTQPEIRNLEIYNTNGKQVGGGVVTQPENQQLEVTAEYNFAEAEDLELAIYDADGLDVTQETLVGPAIKSGGTDESVTWQLQLPADSTGQYEIRVTGSDDLTTESARQSKTITADPADTPDIQWDSTTAYHGTKSTFQIDNADNGEEFIATVNRDAFRSALTPAEILAELSLSGDATEVGIITEDGNFYPRAESRINDIETFNAVYIQLQVDNRDGSARGRFDTGTFDTEPVKVELYDEISTDETLTDQQGTSTAIASDTLTVQTNNLTVEQAPTYQIGTETSINGTATAGVDNVGYYLRQGGEYQLLDVEPSESGLQRAISTDSDGQFELAEQELSAGNSTGNALLRYPGTYQLAVVGITDEATSETLPRVQSSSEIRQHPHEMQPFVAQQANISIQISDQGGEVATTDRFINVTGQAPGVDTVTIVVVDDRGNTVTETASVSDSEYSLSRVDFQSLAVGSVQVYAISPGRDGVYGDGAFSESQTTAEKDLTTVLDEKAAESMTREQILAIMRSETTNDTGSDDSISQQEFQLEEPRIEVQAVRDLETQTASPVGPNTTIIISGRTNLQPEANSIELLLRTPGNETVILTTSDWQFGEWATTFSLDNYGSGLYSIEPQTDVDIVQSKSFLVERQETTEPTPPARDRTQTENQSIRVEEISTSGTSEVTIQYRLTNHGTRQSAALFEVTDLQTDAQIRSFQGDVAQNLSRADPPAVITSQLSSNDSATVSVTLQFPSNATNTTVDITSRVTLQTEQTLTDTIQTSFNTTAQAEQQAENTTAVATATTGTESDPQTTSAQPTDVTASTKPDSQSPSATTETGTGFTIPKLLIGVILFVGYRLTIRD